jgi:hypothetical protein
LLWISSTMVVWGQQQSSMCYTQKCDLKPSSSVGPRFFHHNPTTFYHSWNDTSSFTQWFWGQPVPPDVGSATSSWNHYTQLENTVIIINQTNP